MASKNANKNNTRKSDAALDDEAEMTSTNPAAAKEARLRAASQHTDATMGTGDPTTTKTPRPRIPAGAAPIDILGIHLGDNTLLQQRACLVVGQKPSDEAVEGLATRMSTLAKKVKDKAINLVRHSDNPDNVQVYTRIALDELLAKGELTSKGIQDRYAQVPYKPGTQRAQGNQIMQLFPALNVATKDGSTLRLNEDSTIVQAYRNARQAKTTA
jgi:hypothetical protein